MRTLPPQSELLKVRDHAPIIVLPPDGWYCLYCVPVENDYLGTVTWIVGPNDEEFGRCEMCGQKYVLMERGDD